MLICLSGGFLSVLVPGYEASESSSGYLHKCKFNGESNSHSIQ